MPQEIDFKPSYIWPNPAFHFRLYFESAKCRIFLIENIVHNWNWIPRYASKFRESDYFFVQLGWYFDDWLVEECHRALASIGIPKGNFRILYPDYKTKSLFEYYGFSGEIVNHNCFLDESKFKILNSEKLYDAIYTARLVPFKRHYLANKIKSLALVAGDAYGKTVEEIPDHLYLNPSPISSDEVIVKISQSRVGLILSQFEGACYSSSEYLLCGVPVVSTWSHGGRDVWYNDYNSIICDESPEAVLSAVSKLKTYNRNPEKIRDMHINLMRDMRKNFQNLVMEVFKINNETIDVSKYFDDNFKHKMLTSETPDFDMIFN